MERERGTGNRIAGRQNSRSGEDAAEREREREPDSRASK